MKNRYYLLLILTVFFISCSLERNNPLDPNNSGIKEPPQITGIFVSIVSDFQLHVQWNGIPEEVDGYYIYRSMSFNGAYELIKEAEEDDTDFDDTGVNIQNDNFYWYKMSGYKIVEDQKLEGMRSAPVTWN